MRVEIFRDYSAETFQKFVDFKHKIQKDIDTYFPEEVEEYRKLLEPGTPFMQDYDWVGFIVTKDHQVVAKAILSWRKNSKIGNLGFIDWINDGEVAKFLTSAVESKAKEFGIDQIKTPVDLNFFVKYRIKLPGGGEPFYGEPIYPDYYHELFQHTGFSVVGTWDTYKVNRLAVIKNFSKRRKQLKERKHEHSERVTVRNISISNWDNELAIVYDLFNRSFNQMPEFEPITLAQFRLVYDDFKYIMHPWYSYIVELQGKPVGFSINYPDPLPVLKKIKGKKLSTIDKALLLAKLKLNYKTLLMAYVGKVPGPNGEDIKGVQIVTSKQLTYRGFFVGKGLVCYQSADSPSRRPFEEGAVDEYSKYVLYGKKIS